MLGKQRSVFNEEGLGYIMNPSRKYFRNYFIKASENSHTSVMCKFCGKNGHYNHACSLRKSHSMKSIWSQKNNNVKGPIQKWVPKSTSITVHSFVSTISNSKVHQDRGSSSSNPVFIV